MNTHLQAFDRVADALRPSLRRLQLEINAGSWPTCTVLKVQKRRWAEDKVGAGPAKAGIFFSVWISEKSQGRGRALYNIHALRVRSLRAFSLQAREFAAAFRSRFSRRKGAWPEVSLDFGPQTLMEGWVALDADPLEARVTELVRLFIPVSATIDQLLDQRKAT